MLVSAVPCAALKLEDICEVRGALWENAFLGENVGTCMAFVPSCCSSCSCATFCEVPFKWTYQGTEDHSSALRRFQMPSFSLMLPCALLEVCLRKQVELQHYSHFAYTCYLHTSRNS